MKGLLTLLSYDEEKKLPYEDIPVSLKYIVENAICFAWNLMITDQNCLDKFFDQDSILEDDITYKLRYVLSQMLSDENEMIQGFTKAIFQAPDMDTLPNYNGKIRKKFPDLVFKFKIERGVSSMFYGLFIECKPVDPKRTLRYYFDEGIKRFIDGDYAWAMPSGMMLGYVKENYKSLDDLKIFLEGKEDTVSINPCNYSKKTKVCISVHKRNWLYPQTNKKPSDITIRHLWLVYI